MLTLRQLSPPPCSLVSFLSQIQHYILHIIVPLYYSVCVSACLSLCISSKTLKSPDITRFKSCSLREVSCNKLSLCLPVLWLVHNTLSLSLLSPPILPLPCIYVFSCCRILGVKSLFSASIYLQPCLAQFQKTETQRSYDMHFFIVIDRTELEPSCHAKL